jgi:hypothetical protein
MLAHHDAKQQLVSWFLDTGNSRTKIGAKIMSSSNGASGLHKQAAQDHEAAAKQHHKAAECHDQNKVSDAKESSKSAMGCCNTAQKSSTTACEHTAK